MPGISPDAAISASRPSGVCQAEKWHKCGNESKNRTIGTTLCNLRPHFFHNSTTSHCLPVHFGISPSNSFSPRASAQASSFQSQMARRMLPQQAHRASPGGPPMLRWDRNLKTPPLRRCFSGVMPRLVVSTPLKNISQRTNHLLLLGKLVEF